MNNPEAILLAKTLHGARQLSKFYLGHAKGLDVKKRFKVGDWESNSVHWLVAHLCWTEDLIILQGIRGLGNGINIKWLNTFKIGSEYPAASAFPDYKETLDAFNSIHKEALNAINNLSAEDLKQENKSGLSFGGEKDNEALIRHAVRHEAMHAGHLSWLLRMHGVKKII